MAFESPLVCSSDAGTKSEHHSEYMQFLIRRLLAATEATIN